MKHSLKLAKLILFIFLYIHFSACFWFFICNLDQRWLPINFKGLVEYHQDMINPCELPISELKPWHCEYGMDFYDDYYWQDQWIFTYYNTLQLLLSADITPYTGINYLQFFALFILIMIGALETAYVFGTTAVIVETLN